MLRLSGCHCQEDLKFYLMYVEIAVDIYSILANSVVYFMSLVGECFKKILGNQLRKPH